MHPAVGVADGCLGLQMVFHSGTHKLDPKVDVKT